MKARRPSLHHDNTTSLLQYDIAAQAAAAQVITQYSTSFNLGARLLPRAMRHHIESVYAMVRVADEVVDTYRGPAARAVLDDFETEIHQALERGFSANLVAHAFSKTATAVGIGIEQITPFFTSMRMDLDTSSHNDESFSEYIYGSAAVIGEMCLAVFLNTGKGPQPLPAESVAGARALGNAYQKVNFLRDLATDDGELGRSYFPGVTAANLTDETLAGLVADCRADIATAQTCLPSLPRRARIAVETTVDIYARLLDDIAATPAAKLVSRRVRVRNSTKLVMAARNACPWTSMHRSAA
ncbi:MAG: squalene synthase [Actinobacteria bacterium HGW-Actinobacteria-4]|nr:MAG: squalene synthase [Actinobacteria bacterium HGW-Actinobacteria-4]